jgi:integrase
VSSVHRQDGRPNWFCSYTDHKGVRRFKSCKTTDKREAERVCNELQKIEDKARSGKLNPDNARQVIESTVADILESFGTALEQKSIREHFEGWAKGLETQKSTGTFKRYSGVVTNFLSFLGAKAARPLPALLSSDVERYRDSLTGNVSNGTVNTHLKVIRVCLEKAVKQRVFDRNPARLVENLDRSQRHHRRPFTESELRALLHVASEEWKTMIIVGLYTGMRLSDIANLNWSKIHLEHDEIEVVAEIKTDEPHRVVIAGPLKRHLSAIAHKKGSLVPSLHAKAESWLSNEFWEVMAAAKLVESRRVHTKKKKGRSMKRQQSEITFHSLRHTTTSLLKRAGVSEGVAQDIIGHESEAVSRNYTHIDQATKKTALEKLPDFTK